MTGAAKTHHKTHYEVIVIGAGVAGIYQIKRLADLGVDATVLEAAPRSRRHLVLEPLSRLPLRFRELHLRLLVFTELLDEWHWKERFSGQPENLRYLNYVADKFDLRKYMQFNCKVEAMRIRRDARSLALAGSATAAS